MIVLANGNGDSQELIPWRMNGLDILRGLCALSVAVCHIQLPSRYVADISQRLFLTFANGPAAVVIFFLISGLCIHYSHSNKKALNALVFYKKRAVRIGFPIIVVALIGLITGADLGLKLVAWSLVSEIIYYVLYPGVFRIRKMFGWSPVFCVGLTGASVLLLWKHDAPDFPSYGYSLTWILGFPIWLLGAVLAESLAQINRRSLLNIYLARLLICISSFITILAKQGRLWKVTFPEALVAFSIVGYFWLEAEIRWYRIHPPSVLLNRLGKASYSLYLTHVFVLYFGWQIQFQLNMPQAGFRVMLLIGAIAVAWLFYLTVEAPAHRLASSISMKSGDKPKE